MTTIFNGMKLLADTKPPLGWVNSFILMAAAVVCFHLAYTPLQHPAFGLFILGYAFCLTKLAHQKTVRRAFYFGLVTAYLCVAPQLTCFWEIFNAAAIVLWLVLSFWIGLFTAIVCACIRRWGRAGAMWLVPFVWTGLEYFRSELYDLKFSWLNVGYILPNGSMLFGMYGIGFSVFAIIVAIFYWRLIRVSLIEWIILITMLVVTGISLLLAHPGWRASFKRADFWPTISLVGIQLNFHRKAFLPRR
jgi:apolipoprotein N-acyltransferase